MTPVKRPIVFFTKQAWQLDQGKICLVIFAVWGVIEGGIVPFGITIFMGKIGAQRDLALIAAALSVLFALVGVFRRKKEWVFSAAMTKFKKEGRESIAHKIAKSPFATDGTSKTIVARFLAAQMTAIVTVGEATELVFSIMGFMAVFLIYGVPWWVYIFVMGILAVTIGSYWTLKNFSLFQQAVNKESQVGDILAELRDARNNRQVLPALMRSVKKASQEAFELRTKSDQHTLKYYMDVRNLLNTAINCMATVAAWIAGNTEAAMLLVVFMFTFNSHIKAIHGIADNVDTVETDGEPLLRTATQPPKPLLLPDSRQSEVCLHTSGVVVHYPGKDGEPDRQVSIPDLDLQAGGIYVCTLRNGEGKSSLLKAIAGEVGYTGDLLLWGQSVREFDCSIIVNSFRQVRQPFSATCKELFTDEAGSIDQPAMAYALRLANATDIDPAHIHGELSDGQKQKIDLALVVYRTITMADQVGLVTIDEPTNNLDRPTLALVRKRLVEFITAHVV